MRIEGVVIDINEDIIIIFDILSKNEYISESFEDDLKIGDKVTFIHIDGIATDIVKLK